MSDEELTALAAKAFGNAQHGFSPLSDDGDALRLVVKLELIVGHDAEDKLAYAQVRHPYYSANEFYGGSGISPYAATRRAVVRAAAEVGRRMP